MRFVGRAAFLLFLLLGILVAVSNRQSVELGLWPLTDTIAMPLFLLVPALLLFGILVGLLLGWLGGAGTRRNARLYRREADRLKQEADALRDELSSRSRNTDPASPTATSLSPAGQRSLQRQAALVDPDQVMAARRIG